MKRREKRKKRGKEEKGGREEENYTCSLIAGPKFSSTPCGLVEKQSLGTFTGKTGA